MTKPDFTPQLQEYMRRVGITSFKALSRAAKTSERQLLRLRRGEVEEMRVSVLLNLSQVLQIPLSELVATFSSTVILNASVETNSEYSALQKEYARIQLQLAQQRQTLWQEFQQSSLQVLESLLINLPTVVHKTQEKPDIPAVTVLRLLQTPIAQLLQQWGVEAIAPVGAEVLYNPQLHQLIDGIATVGDTVKVRYTGYRQGDKLLYRAKVSPINQG